MKAEANNRLEDEEATTPPPQPEREPVSSALAVPPETAPAHLTGPPSPHFHERLVLVFSNVMHSLSLDERLGRIILSAVLAVLLWFYVTGLENPAQSTTFRGLTVEVRGVESNLKLISTLPTVDISFQAPQNVMSTLRPSDVQPFVDLTSIGPGVHRVPVRVELNGAALSDLSGLSVAPSEVQVQLEVQSSALFAVAVKVVGTPAFGYGTEQPQVEPREVTVTGSESAIARIASVTVTVDVDEKAGTQRGFKTPVALDAAGQEIPGIVFKPSTVQVTVPIKLLLSNRLVPVRVPILGNPAPGYSVDDIRIDPTNVTICCAPGNILESVASVSTEPVAITGTTSTVVTTTKIILPAGIELYPGQSREITVTVGIRTFETTWEVSVAPSVVGLAPGFTAVLSPGTVDVTLTGTFAQFQALTPGDVQASVSAGSLPPGTYELTPTVSIPNEIRLVSIRPTTVTVSVIAPTPLPATATPTATMTPTSTATPVPPAPPTPVPTSPVAAPPSPTRTLTNTSTPTPTATSPATATPSSTAPATPAGSGTLQTPVPSPHTLP